MSRAPPSCFQSCDFTTAKMSRHTIFRERNQRGLQLFLQNLKGVVNLLISFQETTWTEEIIEITKHRLQDAYATLTLIEHDLDGAPENYTLKESLHLLKSNVQSLHDFLLSHETVASGSSSGSFFTPPVEGREGPGRAIIVIRKDQIEYLRTIHFSWEK